jgi:hypothetical protein
MSDEGIKDAVLPILQGIQAGIAEIKSDVAALEAKMNARFDGVDTRLGDLEMQSFSIKATLAGVRDVAVKALSEAVSMSARLTAVEKRIASLEAPKH